jgi:hypothetical protein
MQQQHRGPCPNSPGSLVGQPESVDRCFLAHTGHYLQHLGHRGLLCLGRALAPYVLITKGKVAAIEMIADPGRIGQLELVPG